MAWRLTLLRIKHRRASRAHISAGKIGGDRRWKACVYPSTRKASTLTIPPHPYLLLRALCTRAYSSIFSYLCFFPSNNITSPLGGHGISLEVTEVWRTTGRGKARRAIITSASTTCHNPSDGGINLTAARAAHLPGGYVREIIVVSNACFASFTVYL